MEPVNAEPCETWRELLAVRAFGDLTEDEEVAVTAHLEGCTACRETFFELESTVAMLAYADPSAVEPMAHVPAELSERVLTSLRHSGERERRRRRTGIAACCFAAAAACALVFALVLSSQSPGPTTRTMDLKGSSSISATAQLVEEPWGTSVTLSESGLPGGHVYTVSMETAKGTWWTAGTYRSVSGATVKATMSCAVFLQDITGLRVENAKGVTVLSSPSASSSTY